jgi:hypothetical protein
MKRITGATPTPTSLNLPSNNLIFPGRVRQIILDDKSYPDAFKNFGEWSSIGNIFFTKINTPNTTPDPFTSTLAKPLFPNQKIYPLKNELVYILALPNTNIETEVDSLIYYYFQPINLWGSNHHNAIPDPILDSSIPDSQKHDYQQTENGAVRRVTDGSTEIDLGNTFEEKLNIKTLLPYEGDIIYEGRWGNSIRFGSTVTNAKIPNQWSRTGSNGDPILILRNGQHEDNKDPWIPQVEDINQDLSSIYMTSTQAMPIRVSSKSYGSYKAQPISPSTFSGEQIILNSGRLLFNAKSDSILLSSNDSINLNSVNSINLDAPKTIIQSKEVILGDKNATEPIILGNKFLTDLTKLLTQIISLSTALQSPIGTPTPFVPNASIPVPAVNVASAATNMLNKIETYKSKVSKTK